VRGPLWILFVCGAWISEAALAAQTSQPSTPPRQLETPCRIEGHVSSGQTPLPGVSVLVQEDGLTKTETSTGVDGAYAIALGPGPVYHLTAALTAFVRVERDVTLDDPPCDLKVDFQLALAPRDAGLASGAASTSTSAPPLPSTPHAGRGAPAGPRSRFQAIGVQPNANLPVEGAPSADEADVARLLPPGFSLQSAQSEVIAINGNTNATSLDRGQLNDRLQAIRLGAIDPVTGQVTGIAGPLSANGAGLPGDLDGRGRGGRGDFPGALGRGGPGGILLGGRRAAGQSLYQGSTTYTFGGSALDTAPYQLRPDVPINQPPFTTNNFGATFGGPVKIPGLYANKNGRTNFQVNYTGNQSSVVFDQYATVPDEAMRRGDFSQSSFALVDPKTGQAFPNNQIPATQIDPGAKQLISYIPLPNLPGDTQNYHVSTTSHSSSENFSARISHVFSQTGPQGPRGPGAGRGGGFGGGGGAFGGGLFGGAGRARGNSVVLNAQIQYRENQTESLNVFPNLGGEATNTLISVPITLTAVRNRVVQTFTVNETHSDAQFTNAFAGVTNVGDLAGIQYPDGVAADPLNWGVPSLLFSGFTGVRSAAASQRSDNRLTTSYMSVKPRGRHQIRFGGDYRYDASTAENTANALGAFTFTGLYSSGGAQVAGRSGADFADFLLGIPQQASLQVGGLTRLRQHSFDVFAEDNWQKSAKLTLNLGVRYELARPYVETDGRMTNLDVTPDFLAASPVISGGVGPYTGVFPAGLLDTDANNVGPRLGLAYRVAKNTVLRTGYGITYNSASYASIARQLTGQPPFAETATNVGAPEAPLTLAEGLISTTTETTNNYGVDRAYALGMIQTWNAALSRDFPGNWNLTGIYTGTKGTDLDILRAPNRGPLGPLIPDVQAFIWESSGGHSLMNAGTIILRKRQSDGIGAGLSYTLAKSTDNASSLGAGAPIVAQNDKDLDSEWALSSFDRRHQVSGDLTIELPFGPNRHWLKNGGWLASLAGGWTTQMTLTLQSGTPFTARVIGEAIDVSRGSNGSLRADYNGEPIQLSDPTIDEFFNAAAFTVPAPGLFGDSARNTIIGPGVRQLNGVLTRDIRLAPNRTISLQINANNLLNAVQWATIDTSVNSPTFGQVLSVRPMRTITISIRFRY
jgi:trimeric autotransporter adhesin